MGLLGDDEDESTDEPTSDERASDERTEERAESTESATDYTAEFRLKVGHANVDVLRTVDERAGVVVYYSADDKGGGGISTVPIDQTNFGSDDES